MKIFPFYSESDNICDGALYKAHYFCKRAFANDRCKKFYLSISKNNGFHICPYGFTAYVIGDGLPILTSLKVNHHYDRKKTKNKKSRFTAKLDENAFLEYIKFLSKDIWSNKLNFIEDMLHDLRKFSKSLNRKSSNVMDRMKEFDDMNLGNNWHILRGNIFDIYIIVSLLSLNITRFDKKLNPSLGMDINTNIPTPIYKRFDRVRYFLNSELRRKKVSMNFHGECHTKLSMPHYVSILPCLLLDNALKYSPSDKNIDVYFSDMTDKVNISIQSIGPLVKEEEKECLFNNGFQGVYAKLFSAEGEGKGLSIARDICDECGISINIDSKKDVIFKKDSIPFAYFVINLVFSKDTPH